MSYDLLLRIITRVSDYLEDRGSVNFIWHGNEPLIVGIEFFIEAVKYQKDLLPNNSFKNGIQTNGLLLNEETVAFLKEENFDVGISIDGPEDVHDQNRTFLGGKGSFSQVSKAINRCRDLDLQFGAIAVLSNSSLNHLQDIYEYFRDINTDWKFNPISPVKALNLDNYIDLSISPKEFGEASSYLFDLWYTDPERTNTIWTFEQIVHNILFHGKRVPAGCNFIDSCQSCFISIESDGSIFPCSRLQGIETLYLGNIATESIQDIFSSNIKTILIERMHQNPECLNCDFLSICNSGCMHNGQLMNGNYMKKDGYCYGFKTLFKHISLALHKDLTIAEGDENERI